MTVIVQCPTCRALVSVVELMIPPGGMRAGFACSACGAQTWLPAAGMGPVVDVPAAATSRARVEPPPALPAPTALVARAADVPAPSSAAAFSAEQRARIEARLAALKPAGAAQEALAAEFGRLLDVWSQEASHKALLKKASMTGELAFAGQSYRAVLEGAPGDATAKKLQGEILTLAMASLASQRDLGSVAEGKSNKTPLVVAAVIILFLLIGGLLVAAPKLLLPSDENVRMGDGAGGSDASPARE